MEPIVDPSQAAAPAPQAGAALPAPNPEIMSPLVQSHMPQLEQMRKMLDGKTGDAYDRVLTAGMKMMYAPQSAEMITTLLEDEKLPMPNKLGEGIANLVVMMDNQGNGTIPKEVIVPVGVALMFEAADYLYELGVTVTDEDLSGALELLIEGVFVGYNIDPAKMEQLIDDMGDKLGFEDSDAGEPAEPAEVEGNEEDEFNKGFAGEQAARGKV